MTKGHLVLECAAKCSCEQIPLTHRVDWVVEIGGLTDPSPSCVAVGEDDRRHVPFEWNFQLSVEIPDDGELPVSSCLCVYLGEQVDGASRIISGEGSLPLVGIVGCEPIGGPRRRAKTRREFTIPCYYRGETQGDHTHLRNSVLKGNFRFSVRRAYILGRDSLPVKVFREDGSARCTSERILASERERKRIGDEQRRLMNLPVDEAVQSDRTMTFKTRWPMGNGEVAPLYSIGCGRGNAPGDRRYFVAGIRMARAILDVAPKVLAEGLHNLSHGVSGTKSGDRLLDAVYIMLAHDSWCGVYEADVLRHNGNSNKEKLIPAEQLIDVARLGNPARRDCEDIEANLARMFFAFLNCFSHRQGSDSDDDDDDEQLLVGVCSFLKNFQFLLLTCTKYTGTDATHDQSTHTPSKTSHFSACLVPNWALEGKDPSMGDYRRSILMEGTDPTLPSATTTECLSRALDRFYPPKNRYNNNKDVITAMRFLKPIVGCVTNAGLSLGDVRFAGTFIAFVDDEGARTPRFGTLVTRKPRSSGCTCARLVEDPGSVGFCVMKSDREDVDRFDVEPRPPVPVMLPGFEACLANATEMGKAVKKHGPRASLGICPLALWRTVQLAVQGQVPILAHAKIETWPGAGFVLVLIGDHEAEEEEAAAATKNKSNSLSLQ